MPPARTSSSVAVHGFALREIRILTGISGSDLARQIGKSPSYISHLERGTNQRVSPETYKALLSALAITDRRVLLADPHGAALAVA